MNKGWFTLSLVKEFKTNYRNVILRLVNQHGDKFILRNPIQNLHTGGFDTLSRSLAVTYTYLSRLCLGNDTIGD